MGIGVEIGESQEPVAPEGERTWVDSEKLKQTLGKFGFPRPVMDRITESINSLNQSGFVSATNPEPVRMELEEVTEELREKRGEVSALERDLGEAERERDERAPLSTKDFKEGLTKLLDDVFRRVMGFPIGDLSPSEQREIEVIRKDNFPELYE